MKENLKDLKEKARFFFKERYKKIALMAKNKVYFFIVPQRVSQEDQIKDYLEPGRNNNEDEQFFLKLSYRDIPKIFEFYRSLKKELVSNRFEFMTKFMNWFSLPPDFSNNISSVLYENGEIHYIKKLNYLVSFFKKLNIDKKDTVFSIDFVSPFPILLNTSFTKNTYQWVHLSINLSYKNIYKINKIFENSDFIFVPILTIGLLSQQAFFKCHFYHWNFKNKKFILISANQYGLLFTTEEKIKKYNIKKIISVNKEEIKKICEIKPNF